MTDCNEVRDRLRALLLATGMLSYNRALDRVSNNDRPSAKTRDWSKAKDVASAEFHAALDAIEADLTNRPHKLHHYLEAQDGS